MPTLMLKKTGNPNSVKGKYYANISNMSDNLIFIYDTFTHQRLLIDEETLEKEFQLYWDWKIYESFTGNPTVKEYIDKKKKKDLDAILDPFIP